MWLSEVNDVSAFAGRRRRAGFPFSERVSGGDRQHGAGDGGQNVGAYGKNRFVMASWTSEVFSIALISGVRAETRLDGRNELKRLERWRRKEGGPENRGRA